jgi:hypothetical protein
MSKRRSPESHVIADIAVIGPSARHDCEDNAAGRFSDARPGLPITAITRDCGDHGDS